MLLYSYNMKRFFFTSVLCLLTLIVASFNAGAERIC